MVGDKMMIVVIGPIYYALVYYSLTHPTIFSDIGLTLE